MKREEHKGTALEEIELLEEDDLDEEDKPHYIF